MKRAIFCLIGAGALLLVLSQFLPLYHAHVTTLHASVGSQTVGSDHSYSVLLLGILALFLGAGVYVADSRFSLALIGLLGAAALGIALGTDLSDARAHGLRSVGGQYLGATNVVAIGLYVEIAGALVLLIAAVVGFLLGVPAVQERSTREPAVRRLRSTPRRDATDGPRRRSRAEVIPRRDARDD